MDAFEQLAADIFWNEGCWVRTGVKVELTKEEKVNIGRHSAPRWEIDLIAYRAVTNELLALECKSYLDSGGVHAAHFLPGSKYAHRYKLFHDLTLRETVLGRLRCQCVERGLCPPDVTLRLGLIHAHATSHNATLLAEIFKREDWLLYGPEWVREHLDRVAAGSWENTTAAVVSKILLRKKAVYSLRAKPRRDLDPGAAGHDRTLDEVDFAPPFAVGNPISAYIDTRASVSTLDRAPP